MTINDGYSYIGKLPCGCVVSAITDKPGDLDWYSEVLKETRKWKREGLAIEYVADQIVREAFGKGCEVCEPQRASGAQMNLFEEA